VNVAEPAATTTIDHIAYLNRINYDGPTTPDAETLRGIVRAHLLAVPFENLDIVPLGLPIRLEQDALFQKIVGHRRGGFCYEVNGLFSLLLQQLGYEVTIVTAQWPAVDGDLTPIFDHMILLVRCPGESGQWLADVAAGRQSTARPLRLELNVQQFLPESGATYRFTQDGDYVRLSSLTSEGDWAHVYSFTEIPRDRAEFIERCTYHQTSPDSHFTQAMLCSLATPEGRITIAGDRLITTIGSEREERKIRDEVELDELLQTHFGIDLSRHSDHSTRRSEPQPVIPSDPTVIPSLSRNLALVKTALFRARFFGFASE
jgi:N-hydroxyarylamine O-acetyltransferase